MSALAIETPLAPVRTPRAQAVAAGRGRAGHLSLVPAGATAPQLAAPAPRVAPAVATTGYHLTPRGLAVVTASTMLTFAAAATTVVAQFLAIPA